MLALTLLLLAAVEIEPVLTPLKRDLDEKPPKSGKVADKSTVRVFIVEDEPTTIILTEAMLNQLGYSPVGVATSFEKAMAALKVISVDIVLVDLTLNGTKTGYDVIKELNRLNIPSVLISGTVDEKTLLKIVELDVYGFLPKPFDQLALTTVIQLALKKFTRMQDRIFDEADSIKSQILSNQALESEFGTKEKLYLIKKGSNQTTITHMADERSFHRAIQWITAFCFFLLGLACFGYLFKQPYLLSFADYSPTMKINTMLCSLLLCFSVAVENSIRATKSFRMASLISLVAVFAIGSLTMLQYIFSVDFGIDEIISRDLFANEFNLPGRMAIPTALGFISLSTAIFLNRYKKIKYSALITESLALITLFLAMVGVFGHLFGKIEFNKVIPYLAQSRVTLTIEILLSLCVLFFNPRIGVMSILSNDMVSAKLGRKMLLSVNATMILISLGISYFVPKSEFDDLDVIFLLITSITILSAVVLWSTLKQIRNELRIEKTFKILKNRARELQFILKRVPHTVAVLDKDMRFILTSRKWVDDFNLKDKRIIGQTVYDIFPQMPEKFRSLHQRALQGEIIKMADEDIVDSVGNRILVKGELRPWFDINDQIAGIIIFYESSTVLPPNQRQ